MRLNRIYRNRHILSLVERLRISQLRDGSLYDNLRTMVPVLALCCTWVWINRRSVVDFRLMLGRSVTVRHLLLAIGTVTLWNVWLGLSLYTRRSAKKDLLAEVTRLFTAACACGALPFLAQLVRGMYGQGFLLAELITSTLLIISFFLLGAFFLGGMLSPKMLQPRLALIVGSGKKAATLRTRLQSHYSPLQLFGCIDDQYHGDDSDADKYLGPISSLAELLKTHPIEVVLIGLPMKSKYDEIQQAIAVCELIGVESHYMHDIFETSRDRVQKQSKDRRHYSFRSSTRRDPRRHLKRIIDLVLSTIILIVVSPVMIAAALAIRLTSAGPILFVQQRYGLNRKRFPMFKFRSMSVDAEQRQAALEVDNEAQGPVFKLRSDPRVTPVGSFLRRTSIDELPQLFNVLRGEMSLVGPRPLPLRDVSRFEESWLLRRFSVRPGLTCLWQVNGRSNTSFDSWIQQDLTYIDEWSLALDFKILILTIPAVLRGSGAV